jgi:hypothetical protein
MNSSAMYRYGALSPNSLITITVREPTKEKATSGYSHATKSANTRPNAASVVERGSAACSNTTTGPLELCDHTTVVRGDFRTSSHEVGLSVTDLGSAQPQLGRITADPPI